jgi:hypothetical protein
MLPAETAGAPGTSGASRPMSSDEATGLSKRSTVLDLSTDRVVAVRLPLSDFDSEPAVVNMVSGSLDEVFDLGCGSANGQITPEAAGCLPVIYLEVVWLFHFAPLDCGLSI